MKRPVVELAGTGRYTPERVMTNADFEQLVDTSDEWIRERTGIRERRIAQPHETVAYMSKMASERALEEAEMDPDHLDAIILATASPDRLLPSNACDMQRLLGANNAAAFDLGAACSGFVYGLSVAEGMIVGDSAKHVLVIGAERLSTIVDWSDRATSILFGDGAGAAIVSPTSNGKRGILSSYLKSDGRLGDLLYRPGGGGNHPPDKQLLDDRSYFIKMAGREVFKSAVRSMSDACDRAMERAGVSAEEIDVMIPHQANIRIIEATAKHAGMPMEKVYINVDRYGNTSAASVAIALDECVRDGHISEGSLVLLVAFGGGFTWGSTVIRW